jgi:hypothetical protein
MFVFSWVQNDPAAHPVFSSREIRGSLISVKSIREIFDN